MERHFINLIDDGDIDTTTEGDDDTYYDYYYEYYCCCYCRLQLKSMKCLEMLTETAQKSCMWTLFVTFCIL